MKNYQQIPEEGPKKKEADKDPRLNRKNMSADDLMIGILRLIKEYEMKTGRKLNEKEYQKMKRDPGRTEEKITITFPK